jgi:hypothetical protein
MQVGKVKPWHTKKRAMYIITRRRSINAALQIRMKEMTCASDVYC